MLDKQELANLYRSGKTLKDIAKIFNVTKSAISLALKSAGVPTNKQAPKTAITKEEILKLIDDGLTKNSIARRESVSVTIINRILRDETKSRNVNVISKAPTIGSIESKLSHQELLKLVSDGFNDSEVAEKFNCSRETICNLRVRYNILPSTKGRVVLTEALLKQAVENNVKNADLSAVTGWALSTIKHKKQEIGLRDKSLWENVIVTDELKSVIAGIYLGDASITKPNVGNHPCLEYGHAADQGNFVRLVYMLLGKLMHGRHINVKAPNKQRPNDDTFYRFRAIAHPFFDELRSNYVEGFYPDKSALKRLGNNILDNLTPLSLALWYMDDGCFTDFSQSGIKVKFCTEGFHIDDIKLLSKCLLDKFGIDTYSQSNNKHLLTGHVLYVQEKSIEKLEELIVPYFIKCMRSKFPGQYVSPPWEDNPDYLSEMDKLVESAPKLPDPIVVVPEIIYYKTTTMKFLDADVTKQVDYTIINASRTEVAEFLESHHYLGRPPHHAKYYVKLMIGERMVGAAAFGSLRSYAVSDRLFKTPVDSKLGLEVSRFACLDSCPTNTESFFLSQCIDAIKVMDENIKFLITYSQPEIGHRGAIYQATNWIYLGNTAGGKVKYLLDNKPVTRKRLKRLHGQETGRREWREIYGNRLQIKNLPSKHKYMLVLDKELKNQLNVPKLDYPK